MWMTTGGAPRGWSEPVEWATSLLLGYRFRQRRDPAGEAARRLENETGPAGAVDRRLISLEHHHPSRGHFSARADSYEIDSCRHRAQLLVPTVPSQDLAPR